MWCLGSWFSAGFGTAGLRVGLDNLKDLFQPQQFHDPTQEPSGREEFSYLALCSASVPLSRQNFGFCEDF